MPAKGGPAFPADQAWPDQGMSLRDYFAAHAMQGIIAGTAVEGASWPEPQWLSDMAYRYADAMIKGGK